MLDCDVRRRILKDFKDEHNHADNNWVFNSLCLKNWHVSFSKTVISSST